MFVQKTPALPSPMTMQKLKLPSKGVDTCRRAVPTIKNLKPTSHSLNIQKMTKDMTQTTKIQGATILKARKTVKTTRT